MSEKIKKILKAKKWTQTRLAKHIGISAQRLNNYIHSKVNHPSQDWITDKIEDMYNAI